MTWIQTGIALTTLIAATAGGVSYFATEADLQHLVQRFDQKQIVDELLYTNQRIWQLEDRYETKDCDKWRDSDRAEYRLLQLRLEILKKEQTEVR